ncbi:hypothetical protein SGFS_013610 [Streptomyces graminofaciens]|uniref:Uncharacterized protein n=1 Tax=Streptomyces graminofaciens TaxID=68212 RepID=A0ABN5V9Z5_9ACTN|nr:hypothetical protein [Streptomyces graminofaciens]BBC30067.1 hypothetical protein SGFS_013610 [Streptomyces graminofaciens]
MTRPIEQLDVDLHALMANIAADTLHAAAARSNSPSDRIAYALDEWLVQHPEAPVSTNADYPGWTPTTTAPKEAS